MSAWYIVRNAAEIDSPSLLIYRERVVENIRRLTASIDDVARLRPHVKTHKSPQVTALMIAAGINRFKCATIAEAEMLAVAGAQDVLLAYQPVGPKARRFLELTRRFPEVTFSCLVDNPETARELASVFYPAGPARVFIDLNVGMNRTGIDPTRAFPLACECLMTDGLELAGLHAYDGHIRDEEYAVRKRRSDEAFASVEALRQRIIDEKIRLGLGESDLVVVAGGTPTYTVHCLRPNVECSPGTFIYWDKGYESILHEQHYLHAAVVLTRVISKPSENIICIDLGHKSIASENPLSQRVFFLNAPGLEPIGHSEEHMVFRDSNAYNLNVGDVLYGVPYHVCPTIALYERSAVVSDGSVTEWWTTTSRNRMITL